MLTIRLRTRTKSDKILKEPLKMMMLMSTVNKLKLKGVHSPNSEPSSEKGPDDIEAKLRALSRLTHKI